MVILAPGSNYSEKCPFTPKRPVVTRGDSFQGRVALKLVTKLVCIKVLINLGRFAPRDKTDFKKRQVCAKTNSSLVINQSIAAFNEEYTIRQINFIGAPGVTCEGYEIKLMID